MKKGTFPTRVVCDDMVDQREKEHYCCRHTKSHLFSRKAVENRSRSRGAEIGKDPRGNGLYTWRAQVRDYTQSSLSKQLVLEFT
jgi:hypothetical protein